MTADVTPVPASLIPILLGDDILQEFRSLGMNAQANRRHIARIIMKAEAAWQRLPSARRGPKAQIYRDLARELQDKSGETLRQWAWLEREFGDFLDEYADLCTYTWLRDVVKREAVQRGVESSIVLRERLDESVAYGGRLVPLDVFRAQRRNGKPTTPPIHAALTRAVKNLGTAARAAIAATMSGRVSVDQQRRIAQIAQAVEELAKEIRQV